jgi:hypothetical protein
MTAADRIVRPDWRHRRAAADSTARSRLCRQRGRDGMVPLTTWQNEAEVDALLKHHGKAPRHGWGDDNDKRNAAWAELVKELLEVDARQHHDE